MPVPDLFAEGLARGWKTYNGSRLDDDLELEADVVVVGTGAGGGTTAEILSAAGLKVLLVEEGPLKPAAISRCRRPTPTPSCTRKASAG
ncbi:hypothetical protein ACG3RN_09805 [Pseudomonas aeruginosa]